MTNHHLIVKTPVPTLFRGMKSLNEKEQWGRSVCYLCTVWSKSISE